MKRLVMALTGLLVIACSKESGFVIDGTTEGFEDGAKVYIQKLAQNNRLIPIDTVEIKKSKFKLNFPFSGAPEINVLTTSETKDRVLLIEENEVITIKLFKDSLSSSVISGGKENSLFYNYIQSSKEQNAKKSELGQKLTTSRRESDGIMVQEITSQLKDLDISTKKQKQDIVKNNPNSIVSIIVLSDLINGKALDISQTENYFEKISSDVKATPMGKSIGQYIAQQKSQRIAAKLADVGNKAPEFKAPTPEGEELALSETLGKYTIIDFWASWCRPCRIENPNVVRVYNKYHDQGLNIVSVSLDRKGHDNRWRKAIVDDQMDWYHVSNLQFWQDPIAKDYGVRSIPATFLLDENGVIIAKNLRGPALERKMKELFEDS